MKSDLHIINNLEKNIENDLSRPSKASYLRALYETLAEHLFHQYEPTRRFGGDRLSRDFMVRLNNWLACFDDEEDQWLAFKSIEYFFFAGQLEFEELYRCAVDNVIKPWVVDMADIDIFDSLSEEILANELGKVWPCPITDSLRINSFLHLTGLSGQSLRPDWMSLNSLGDPDKIKKFCYAKDLKYLVLLEDFVGSGGQIARILKFIFSAFPGPILIIPLIICEKGDEKIKQKLKELDRKNISYQPISVVPRECSVTKDFQDNQPVFFDKLKTTLKKGYETIGQDIDGEEFGWKGTGSLIALYSNCPNNTPPIYHKVSKNWAPVFPRYDREMEIKK